MKQKFCIAGILLLGVVCAQANNYEVTSPDGRLAVKVECVDGKAFSLCPLFPKPLGIFA